MAKTQPKSKNSSSANSGSTNNVDPRDEIITADGEPLNLRNRYLAAFLAWLIPGAGHFYQRRYFKAGVFFLCVSSSFLIGLLVSGMNCVYASWNETEKRWQFVPQVAVGLPTMPAVIQGWRSRGGNPPLWNGFMSGPKGVDDLDRWNKETASGFDMGTLYTMVAGLLNILVIFDAYAGPLPPPRPKKSPNDDDQTGDSKSGDSPPVN